MSSEREKRSTSQPESYKDFDRSGRTSTENKGEGEDFIDYFAPSEDPVLGSETKGKKKLRARAKSAEAEEVIPDNTEELVVPEVPEKEDSFSMEGDKNSGVGKHVAIHSTETVSAVAPEIIPRAPKTPKKANKRKNTMSTTDFNKLMNSGATLDSLSDEQIARLSEEQFNLLLDGEKHIQEQIERDRVVRARRHQQMLAREERMRAETESRMIEQKQEEELLLARENRLRLEAEAKVAEQKRQEEFLFLQQQRIRLEQESRSTSSRLVHSAETDEFRSDSSQKFQFLRPTSVLPSEPEVAVNKNPVRVGIQNKSTLSSVTGPAAGQSETDMNLDRLFASHDEARLDLSETAKRLADDENLYDCSATGVKSLQQHGLWLHDKRAEQNKLERGRSSVRTTPPYGISKKKHHDEMASGPFNPDQTTLQNREKTGESKEEKIKSGITEKAEASVRQKLTWPQKNLGFKFIQEPLGFNQLTFEHLIVGEITTIRNCQNILEAKHRMRLLERIGYWRLRGADWSQIRAFYAAIIAGIEAEEFNWDVSFADIESMIIDKPLVAAAVKPDKKNVKSKKAETLWFCRDFNSELGCDQDSGHMVVTPRGDSKAAMHICSRCWRIKKYKKEHSESSLDCPLRGQ